LAPSNKIHNKWWVSNTAIEETVFQNVVALFLLFFTVSQAVVVLGVDTKVGAAKSKEILNII
jgi:hypothetical protein